MADWDTSSPTDNAVIAQYPANERAARVALVTNFGVDHVPTDGADVGKHKVIQLVNQSDPSAASGEGKLYAKEVSGQSELMWRSSTGSVIQLTVQGGINGAVVSTGISGTNISTGTVADARLSSNVPLKNASNEFTAAAQTVSNETNPRWVATDGTVTVKLQTTGGTTGLVGTESNHPLHFFVNNNTVGSIATNGTWTLNGVAQTDYARLSQVNSFTASGGGTGSALRVVAGSPFVNWYETDGGSDEKNWDVGVISETFRMRSLTDADGSATSFFVATRGTGVAIANIELSAASLTLSGAVSAPTIAQSTSTTLAAGQVHAIDGNATLPNMAAGQWVTVINNGSSARTVTKNGSDTMYWTATGSSVTSVTIPARGRASFVCADGTNVYASGNITGSS